MGPYPNFRWFFGIFNLCWNVLWIFVGRYFFAFFLLQKHEKLTKTLQNTKIYTTKGMISDSFGRKIVFLGGFFINSLFGMFSAVAPGYYSFFALRAISGLGLGAAIPVSLGWALEFSAIKKRGALSAFMNIFWAFGAIACCLMAWIIIPTIGWRWLVFIVNFIGFSCFFSLNTHKSLNLFTKFHQIFESFHKFLNIFTKFPQIFEK